MEDSSLVTILSVTCQLCEHVCWSLNLMDLGWNQISGATHLDNHLAEPSVRQGCLVSLASSLCNCKLVLPRFLHGVSCQELSWSPTPELLMGLMSEKWLLRSQHILVKNKITTETSLKLEDLVVPLCKFLFPPHTQFYRSRCAGGLCIHTGQVNLWNCF